MSGVGGGSDESIGPCGAGRDAEVKELGWVYGVVGWDGCECCVKSVDALVLADDEGVVPDECGAEWERESVLRDDWGLSCCGA